MEIENININATENNGKPVEVILREGKAAPELEPKAPVKTNLSGTIGTVVEYLTKRINAEQFLQKDCHIIVDREKVSIELVINEADEYIAATSRARWLSTRHSFVSASTTPKRIGNPPNLVCSAR